jgi:hypothetical protein
MPDFIKVNDVFSHVELTPAEVVEIVCKALQDKTPSGQYMLSVDVRNGEQQKFYLKYMGPCQQEDQRP